MISLNACSSISGTANGLKEYNKNNKTMSDGVKNIFKKFSK
jgi:hypothetical protein|tara:strand:+ start:51 stop:173 length:123 start_codon:yes stop_codon:yes gene_type:complete